jgi:hypothetical protein
LEESKIINNFVYHPPKDGQAGKFIMIRDSTRELALLINQLVPDSREKTIAISKIEESVMWANAGIARNE